MISVQLCGDMEAAEVGHDAENDRVDCPTCGTAIIPATGIEDDIDEDSREGHTCPSQEEGGTSADRAKRL